MFWFFLRDYQLKNLLPFTILNETWIAATLAATTTRQQTALRVEKIFKRWFFLHRTWFPLQNIVFLLVQVVFLYRNIVFEHCKIVSAARSAKTFPPRTDCLAIVIFLWSINNTVGAWGCLLVIHTIPACWRIFLAVA